MPSTASVLIMQNALLSTKLAKRVDGQLSMHGTSFTEFMIMHHLFDAPNRTMRRIDLAECVALSASGVTRLLAPMEKNNIVEKEINPRDARVSLVKLSKTGERLFKESSTTFEHSAKSLTSNLSISQMRKLLELTNLLL